MKNLVMALMMLLVLGTGFLLGSKQSLSEDPADILELTKNTSNNVNNQKYLKGDLSKGEEDYETVDDPKDDFKENSNNKSNIENDEIVNNESINEEPNNEDDSKSEDENSDKDEKNQLIKSIS